ncbi:MAG: redoxin domain-containing protein, partial [Turicibacter sp.]
RRPRVGQVLKSFTYDTPWTNGIDFSSQSKDSKSCIVFLRYYGCTLCQLDIRKFMSRYNEFTEKGIELYIVLQSDPQLMREQLNKEDVPFNMICDPNQELYHQFYIKPAVSQAGMIGVEALEKIKESMALGIEHGAYEGNEQQLPAVVMCNEKGEITFTHYGKNVGDIPSIDELLTNL